MKQLFSFVIALLILSSCAKDQQGSARRVEKSIEGSWELRQTSAAMVPGAQDYAPGNGNLLKFSDGQYERYTLGNLVQSGSYEILNDDSVEQNVCLVVPNGKYGQRIVYDGNTTAGKMFLHIEGDQLLFISGCYALDGGYQMTYKRKK